MLCVFMLLPLQRNLNTKYMNWINLLLAGLFEIGWTIGLKQMDNHKNILWTAIFYISIVTSFYFLQQALKVIPIGTAYAIYTSIGAVGTVIIGMIFFKEPATLIRIGFILLIITGVIGLKLTSTH
ncbi:multidrug efflux SMR transporter [Flavobacterium sp.]|uniref:DMT family transporter n=1 Tax=Flavobacterium sp. TaxID=239 RepID=UPI00338E2726